MFSQIKLGLSAPRALSMWVEQKKSPKFLSLISCKVSGSAFRWESRKFAHVNRVKTWRAKKTTGRDASEMFWKLTQGEEKKKSFFRHWLKKFNVNRQQWIRKRFFFSCTVARETVALFVIRLVPRLKTISW